MASPSARMLAPSEPSGPSACRTSTMVRPASFCWDGLGQLGQHARRRQMAAGGLRHASRHLPQGQGHLQPQGIQHRHRAMQDGRCQPAALCQVVESGKAGSLDLPRLRIGDVDQCQPVLQVGGRLGPAAGQIELASRQWRPAPAPRPAAGSRARATGWRAPGSASRPLAGARPRAAPRRRKLRMRRAREVGACVSSMARKSRARSSTGSAAASVPVAAAGRRR